MVQIWRGLSCLLVPRFIFFCCSLSEILHPSSWLSVLKIMDLLSFVYRAVQFCFVLFQHDTCCKSLNGSPFEPQKDMFRRFLMLRSLLQFVSAPCRNWMNSFHGLQLSTWKQKANWVLHHSFVVPSPACWLKRFCFLLSASFLGSSKRWYMRRAFRLESNITSRPEEWFFASSMWTSRRFPLLWADEYDVLFLIEATSTLAFIIALSQNSLKRCLDIREGSLPYPRPQLVIKISSTFSEELDWSICRVFIEVSGCKKLREFNNWISCLLWKRSANAVF